MDKKMEWYWNLFAMKPREGMTWKEYVMGSKIESPVTHWTELEHYFKKLDKDGNGRLSHGEFMSMKHMKEKKGGKSGDKKRGGKSGDKKHDGKHKEKKEKSKSKSPYKFCERDDYQMKVIAKENEKYNYSGCKQPDADGYWNDYPIIGRGERKGHLCYPLYYRAMKCDSKGKISDEKI